jgi:hypothetical protein
LLVELIGVSPVEIELFSGLEACWPHRRDARATILRR